MFIKTIEFKNVASYGNKLQKIEFDNQASFYLLLGQNGAGKSTISQVIKLGLYGKTGDGKKIKDIANRINKNAWIKITLETKIGEIVIERGFEPTFLKLFINDMEYDQAGKKEVQYYIEEEILEIPFYVFNNIISLSINDFKSFLKMSNYDKKTIIDKIFGFSIINSMRDIIKNEVKTIKEFLDRLDGKLSTLVSNIDSSIGELNSLNEKLNNDNKSKKEELEEAKIKITEFKVKVDEKCNEIFQKERELLEQKNKIRDVIHSEKVTLKSIKEKEDLYANDKCPECSSDLHTKYHKQIIDSYLDLKEKTSKSLETHIELLKTLEEKERNLKNIKQEISEKLKNAEVKLRVIDRSLNEIVSNSKSQDQTISLNKLIENLETQLKDSKAKQYKLNKQSQYLTILDEILGEKGLKQMAVKTILPALNSEIYNLMQTMHLDYRVVFDEEFNANISHYGYEINSSSLSTGEMKKVDFAVLVSIIKLMKLKFPSVNLLFLDEIFSSLDDDSRFTILKILSTIVRDLNLNTFVINHSELPQELFHYKVEISKNNNFSSIELTKI